jgi:hypothetical protein
VQEDAVVLVHVGALELPWAVRLVPAAVHAAVQLEVVFLFAEGLPMGPWELFSCRFAYPIMQRFSAQNNYTLSGL